MDPNARVWLLIRRFPRWSSVGPFGSSDAPTKTVIDAALPIGIREVRTIVSAFATPPGDWVQVLNRHTPSAIVFLPNTTNVVETIVPRWDVVR